MKDQPNIQNNRDNNSAQSACEENKFKRSALVTGVIRGLVLTLIVTLIARVVSIVYSLNAGANAAVDRALDIVIYVLDSMIFACGAATILQFIRDKRAALIAFAAIVLLTALDYATSYVLDAVLGNFTNGTEGLVAIYLILNVLARAMTLGLMIVFAAFFSRSLNDAPPFPLFSRRHAVPISCATASILRIVPALLYELYANISGIIEYGWEMTSNDVLSIISAYAEIAVDGAIVYFTVYIVSVMLRRSRRSKRAEMG